MGEQFLYSKAPDDTWQRLHETLVSPFVLESIVATYKEYGFDIYAYNTDRRKTIKKYDELRVWIYYKKALIIKGKIHN